MNSEAAVVYELKHPIVIRAKESDEVLETLKTLKLARPKGKHLKKMDSAEGEVGKTLALIAALASVPPSHLNDLDGEDFAALGEIIQRFFGGRLQTLMTSSETSQ